jgi:hypothetical protein
MKTAEDARDAEVIKSRPKLDEKLTRTVLVVI